MYKLLLKRQKDLMLGLRYRAVAQEQLTQEQEYEKFLINKIKELEGKY